MGLMACGERVITSEMKPQHYCLVCCCPCCLGPPCSQNRQRTYKNMLKTFSAVLMMVLMLVFVAELFVGGLWPCPAGGGPCVRAVQDWSNNPSLGPSTEVLFVMGASYGFGIKVHVQLWRYITPIFLHAGFLHLLGNGLFLIMMGLKFEQEWGWRRYIPLFFVAGIGGSAFSIVVHPDAIGVGASGALFGLLGGQISNYAMHWSTMNPLTRRSQLIQLLVFAVIWTILGFTVQFIDGYAHLGGMITGFLWGLVIWGPEHTQYALVTKYARWVGVLGLVLLFGLSYGLFFGVATVCPFPNPELEPLFRVLPECFGAFVKPK